MTFRILVVCIGNICRSPLGELLLSARLPRPEFEVRSAGVMAMVGQGIDPFAAIHAAAEDIDSSAFRSQQITTELVQQSDLVLTATKELRSRVLSEWPAALRRTFTVLECADLLDEVTSSTPEGLVAAAAAARSQVRLTELDIPDPFKRGEQAHLVAADLMRTAADRIARGLVG